MSRADIANYLRLAPETVSRILRRFQDEQLVRVRGREIELLDAARLESAAAPVLREVRGSH
jgi:CRP/FNR family transcriptional regulator